MCKRSYLVKHKQNIKKVQKLVPVLDTNFNVKNTSKLSEKYLERSMQNMQNQTITKYFSNPEAIFRSAKGSYNYHV